MPSRPELLRRTRAPRWHPKGLAALGALSLILYWVPFAAPLIQVLTVVQCVRAARWGVAEAWSLALGIGGALAGFGLFLARGHLGL